jgi:hypothetical protein
MASWGQIPAKPSPKALSEGLYPTHKMTFSINTNFSHVIVDEFGGIRVSTKFSGFCFFKFLE